MEDITEQVRSIPISFLKIENLVETVSVYPSYVPVKLYDQVKIYVNSFSSPSAYRICFYNNKTNAWLSASLT